MMFVNDSGEILEVEGDLFHTKRAANIVGGTPVGDYSVNFNIDNNSENRKKLGYYGPQMLTQAAFLRQSWTLTRNGNPFIRGSIIIQQDKGKTLSCYFVSGNSSWVNLLTGLITELDFTGVTNGTDYRMQLTASNVFTSMSATEGMIFPMVDWCYKLNKGSNEWMVFDIMDVRRDPYQSFFDLYPCFYLHTLVKEILQQNGLKLSGNILDDGLYKTLTISPVRGDMRRGDVNITTAEGVDQTRAVAGEVQYTSFTETSDPYGLFASSQYTANQSAKIFVTLILTNNVAVGGILPLGEIRLRKNGVQVGSTIQFNSILTPNTYVFETSVVAGDVLSVGFNRHGTSTSVTIALDIKIDIPTRITVNDYIDPSYFLPAFTCLDIIKFVVNYFGASCYFDEYSKTLTVNIIEKLKTEDADDWSDYYQSHQADYTAVAGASNYLKVAESDETELRAYDKAHVVKYGEGNIEVDNTLKPESELITSPFGASFFQIAKNGNWNTMVDLIHLKDSGDPLVYTAIADDGFGVAQVTYSVTPSDIRGQIVRIVDDNRGDIGYYVVTSTDADKFYGFAFPGDTSTGKIYPQEITYNQISPRLLVVTPINFTDLSTVDSTYNIRDTTYGVSGGAKSTTTFAHFVKSITGKPIDFIKTNAAFGNPDVDTFVDPPVKDQYFDKVGRMIARPLIPATLTLPEAVYQSFIFDRFIHLKTKDLTGYFWVGSIDHYRNGVTDVKVPLYMV